MGNLLDGVLDEESELYTVDELRQMIDLLARKITERTGSQGTAGFWGALVGVVRDLAACNPPIEPEFDCCVLCESDVSRGPYNVSRYVKAQLHKPTCPWRRAVEIASHGRDPDEGLMDDAEREMRKRT